MQSASRRRLLAVLGTGVFGTSALGTSALGTSALGTSALGSKRVGPSESRQNDATEVFGAWLTGANELPPIETDAVGFAAFAVSLDERRVEYWLVVSDIENVEESHVHKGPPDLNGNVVAYLFGPVERPVGGTGLLASGRLTDEDAIWPLTDVAGLVAEMRDENVYVNVHTTAHPSGEIRGQIRPVGGSQVGEVRRLDG